MLGIELTTGQKIQIAIIFVVLGVAGYFVFRSTQPRFDSAINSYVEMHDFAANGRPVKLNDKTAAAEKHEVHTFFACNDGQIEIVEYPNDPSKHPQIKFHPDPRNAGKTYIFYQDPMAPVAKISDPFRHALAYATYSQVFERPMGLLSSTNMTPDQAAKEQAARTTMNNEISLIKTGIENGTYQTKLMDEVMKALAAYNAKSGDPLKDATKAALAHKVLESIKAFESKRLLDIGKQIDVYMDVMVGLLNQTQKDALVNALTARLAPRAPATNRRPPAAGGGATTARGGGAGARGGRGAATRGATTATAPEAG